MVKRVILFIFLFLLISAGGVFLYLKKTNYWSERNTALRELKELEIPATPSQVRSATMEGDHTRLNLLSKAGIDFNDQESRGENLDYPLHIAVKKKDWETFQILIDKGVNPNLKDAKNLPVTTYLLEAGNIDLAEQVISDGAEVNILHSSGEPYLIYAIQNTEVAIAKMLLEQGSDPNVKSKDVGESALSLCFSKKLPLLAQDLLEMGADPNGTTQYGTPLFPNVCRKFPTYKFTPEEEQGIINKFIEQRVDLNLEHSSGWRGLQWLIKHGKVDLVERVLEKDRNVTDTLWIALKEENYTMVERLLDLGVNPNESGSGGESPLLTMVRKDNAKIITKLLDKGANPEQLGIEGQSALFTAIALKKTEAALALLDHSSNGAHHSKVMEHPVTEDFRGLFGKKGYFDWYARNRKGLTPLMAAVFMKNLVVAEKLIEKGADRNQGTDSKYKVYPIQMASENKDVKMQQLLVGVPYEDDQQERHFIVDLSEQKVFYYQGEELIKSARCSTGRSGYRTEPGHYVITDKTRHKRSNIYNGAEMPYFQRFSCGAIGFHEGNTYSRYASHGCIRLPMSVAKFFWSETSLGDRIEIRK